MHCFYFGGERECTGTCGNCPYGFNPFPSIYTISYQYKCSCGGEFITPERKPIQVRDTETGKSVSVMFGKVCPFCGKEMKGLS